MNDDRFLLRICGVAIACVFALTSAWRLNSSNGNCPDCVVYEAFEKSFFLGAAGSQSLFKAFHIR